MPEHVRKRNKKARGNTEGKRGKKHMDNACRVCNSVNMRKRNPKPKLNAKQKVYTCAMKIAT